MPGAGTPNRSGLDRRAHGGYGAGSLFAPVDLPEDPRLVVGRLFSASPGALITATARIKRRGPGRRTDGARTVSIYFGIADAGVNG